ncbi:MAG TPA: UvrD-helicase domain-containing protein, partial [Roseiarcus sp.]
MREARAGALAALGGASESAGALELVACEAGPHAFDDLLKEALSGAEPFCARDDAPGYVAALAPPLGLAPNATAATVEAEMLGGDIGRKLREAWARQLEGGSVNDRNLAEKFRSANADGGNQPRIQALLDAFFKEDGAGEPRDCKSGDLGTKGLRKAFPALEEELRRERDRQSSLRERWRAALTLDRSAALFVVAKAILSTFARMKAERGALDFNDQIVRALALVTRSSASWVLHKLDYGLDHMLIDEAQDASAPQWGIVEALSAEFFAGASARAANRTVFAVGDEKQSIFAFQGAAPQMFAEMKRAFDKRHRDAERPFADVPLTFSFRSSQTILDAVDKTFGSDAAWRGVAAAGEPPPRHEAIRSDLKGVVELWPPMAPSPAPDPEDWRLPLDHASPDDPPVVLAKRIAQVIKGWVSANSRERVVDPLTGQIRAIRESDVMILVRSRNAFFEAMVRALKAGRLKTAGADRLKLKDHIAVMDLIVAGRVALLPDDDLTLASALKSPLIGLDDNALL